MTQKKPGRGPMLSPVYAEAFPLRARFVDGYEVRGDSDGYTDQHIGYALTAADAAALAKGRAGCGSPLPGTCKPQRLVEFSDGTFFALGDPGETTAEILRERTRQKALAKVRAAVSDEEWTALGLDAPPAPEEAP